jgi:nicotinate-nucleotide pyrophosphorylase (carboxylating)
MNPSPVPLPAFLILDRLIEAWLLEDIGRGDQTTQALLANTLKTGEAQWICKEAGVIAGLPIAARVFQHLNRDVKFLPIVAEGQWCDRGEVVAQIEGAVDALLSGERVALNLAMRLSGIATLTRRYVEKIADLPTQLVDTRKTTPGLRILEKYATQAGGATNHRMGLDDGVMLKDNHITVAGGIQTAIEKIRNCVPYPLSVEVETETLEQVAEALKYQADIIMLDNMPLDQISQAVQMIREANDRIKIEASGNITLETLRVIAETQVDYISTSAPITRSTWLVLSMKML